MSFPVGLSRVYNPAVPRLAGDSGHRRTGRSFSRPPARKARSSSCLS